MSLTKSLTSNIVSAWDDLNSRLARVNPVWLVAGSVGGTVVLLKVRKIWRRSDRPLHKRTVTYAFSWICCLPWVRRKIEKELAQTKASLERTIHSCDEKLVFLKEIPHEPISHAQIIAVAEEYQAMNKQFDYIAGRVSGAVYTNLAEDHIEVLTEVFKRYAFSNPLHPDVFPGCRKMEAEVIRMVANLFHGPPESCGTMTSGGTESLILVCLASRNRAIAKGIDEPVIVVPVTAHAGFDKAASLLGIRIRHVPVDPVTSEVDIVGSAPNFPFGTVDNIPAIAKIGEQRGIPVHVDCCLGGFLVAFAEEADIQVPVFDFRLPGVTSISCDTHKYGYAPKGTSTILYRSAEFLHHQYFSVTEWPGGIYATPTLAGSRAGLNIALTWATLLHFGRGEYVSRARKITAATRQLADAIAKVPGLEVVGRPDVSVVAFRSPDVNIYAVGDKLNKLGWNLNTLQMPDSIHFCLTYNQASDEVITGFVNDLKFVTEEVAKLEDKGKDSHTAAIYGMAAQIPDKSLVDEVAYLYLDSCYAMPAKE
ncbi:pyridoxal-dependent decarboxylase conserved domain-containing protein [Ditylenchus destructor]|uniref:sphinganine-1-phosphate aldolase n=1 Tax=Ditylenchus destructor TaxID=166010 RepID=A0AAD4R4M8_9BILA|nr:pyridoxal-dependent decarboxylase conserved domain-containing protein [Ditylenchus destructor]